MKEVGLGAGAAPAPEESASPNFTTRPEVRIQAFFRGEPVCSKACWRHLVSSVGVGAAAPEGSSCGGSGANRAERDHSQERGGQISTPALPTVSAMTLDTFLPQVSTSN